MTKRRHKGSGGFIRAKALTRSKEEVYDVVAVNKKTGEIRLLDKVETIDKAKDLVKNREMDGFRFYFLENNTVLLELV